jgi:SAM-dependent methyltransferase
MAMAQNIYDNETFFNGYSRLPRSIEGLDGAPEWPTLRAMLPALDGRRVLDLGCGFGWFCRWARQNGAASVLGVDVSERMLARATAESDDAAISYARADLENLNIGSAMFDLTYSSLALHYVANMDRLIASVHAALVPGGRLVFSVEHPMFTAPSQPDWSVDTAGRATWPVDGYLDEGPRSTDWLAKGVIKQHRTIATYANLLLRSGFSLTQVEEWGPSKEQVARHPEWVGGRERPAFLLMAWVRAAEK